MENTNKIFAISEIPWNYVNNVSKLARTSENFYRLKEKVEINLVIEYDPPKVVKGKRLTLVCYSVQFTIW